MERFLKLDLKFFLSIVIIFLIIFSILFYKLSLDILFYLVFLIIILLWIFFHNETYLSTGISFFVCGLVLVYLFLEFYLGLVYIIISVGSYFGHQALKLSKSKEKNFKKNSIIKWPEIFEQGINLK